MKQDEVQYIIIDRKEGRLDEINRPEVFSGPHKFADAEERLNEWRKTAPAFSGGYHKTDVLFVSSSRIGRQVFGVREDLQSTEAMEISLEIYFE